MKTTPLSLIATGLSTFLLSPAFAIEAPEDNAPPPPAQRTKPLDLPEIKLNPDERPAPQKSIAYLGIVSGEVPAVLAEHLCLPPGEGILVRSLVPNGPASQSGIHPNDVITQIDGQSTGSPLDFSKKISSHPPRKSLTLDVIHKGKSQKLQVTLGVRPDDLASSEPPSFSPLGLDELPRDIADRIRGSISGNLGHQPLSLGSGSDPMDETVRELQKQMQSGLLQPGLGNSKILSNSVVKMRDEQGTVEIRSQNGVSQVTVLDAQDKLLWSGPWDSEADKSSAPPAIAKRLNALNLNAKN